MVLAATPYSAPASSHPWALPRPSRHFWTTCLTPFVTRPNSAFSPPPHTQRVIQQIQAWRRPTNPIDSHSITHRSSPPADTSLVIAVPPPEDAPRIAARLLSSPIPFAVLLPAELAPRIADDGHFPDQPDLAHLYRNGGKIMFLDSDQLWFVGNLPSLQQYSKICAQILQRSSPLLEHFTSSRDPTLPTTIAAWKQAQSEDPAFLADIPLDSLLLCYGLNLFKDPDFPSRILVPPSLREALVRQHHADLQHHTQKYSPLSRGIITGRPSRPTSANSSKTVSSAKMNGQSDD
jgi:hypothetical protein